MTPAPCRCNQPYITSDRGIFQACQALGHRPACEKEPDHSIEPACLLVADYSRRQRASDLRTGRPRQETSTDTVLLQRLVT